MLHRLILKVTKFQLPPPERLITVVKNIFGASCPPMSNRVERQIEFAQPYKIFRAAQWREKILG